MLGRRGTKSLETGLAEEACCPSRELGSKFSRGDGHEMTAVRLKSRKKRKYRGSKRKSEGTCCLL